ncbi:MAG TPA: hypothetical protein VL048_14685 [Xanthobacteraceae bacterium]|nr:hypothetical protein [Xanthobacteraceae bacterium]
MPFLTQPAFMIDRSKKITARFYATVAGQAPVGTWLLELLKAHRRSRLADGNAEQKTQKTPPQDIELAL